MIATGTGSEIRQPLGYAMVGGLAVSQVLTLFTTPVIYIYLDRLAHRLSFRDKPTVVDAEAGDPESVPVEEVRGPPALRAAE